MSIYASIKNELRSNLDASAQEVVSKLATKGIHTTPAAVYCVRSGLKKKRRAAGEAVKKTAQANDKPLSHYIFKALKLNDLDLNGLQASVLEQGYVTHSQNFRDVLKAKLYELVKSKKLTKNVAGIYVDNTKPEVKEPVAGIYVYNTKPEVKEPVSKVRPTGENYYKDQLDILCRALVKLAQKRGLVNPDVYPQNLIDAQIRYELTLEKASKEYDDSII